MFRKAILLIVLLAVVSVGVYFYLNNHRGANGTITLYGNVDIRQVDLGFRVYGRVAKLFYDEGDEVEPGQLMAELDPVPYEESLLEAVGRAKAVERRLANARLLYERRRVAVGSGAVSRENTDDALANMEELQAEFEAATAAVAHAQTNLADTKMYCPSLGTILTRIREPGSVVNIGEPVFTLSIMSPVWVRTYISEPLLGLIGPGMEAEVITDTPGGRIYRGHVGFISPVAEFTPKSVETTSLRTDLVYRVRVVVDDPDYSLKQGMPVTVKFHR